eukprot:Tamp_13461.p1 GENE.Tamp_13461~~Tamp_13461.p1  ORF type:complete len:269 (+),score=63.52 Tamp_13461:2-808(+)
MRYGGEELDAGRQAEAAQALVETLRSADAAEVAAAAAELYKMTSFSSAVAIDRPEAMTDYDRAVFGSGAGPGAADAGGCGAADFKPGEAHLDGHRYLMGDGFMLNEEEGKDGSVRTRRVAVMHSRNCLDNRSIIGKVPGVFEALLVAIRSKSAETRYQACRAASQVVFRNSDNKRALGGLPDAMPAMSEVVNLATQEGDKRTLAQACRLLGVLVAGDEKNCGMAAQDANLVANLRACLLDGQDEVSGQAGKVLNSISYLIPEHVAPAR